MHSIIFLTGGLLSVANAVVLPRMIYHGTSDGCVSEPTGDVLLDGPTFQNTLLTIEMCETYCQNYAYYGVENGNTVRILPTNFAIS